MSKRDPRSCGLRATWAAAVVVLAATPLAACPRAPTPSEVVERFMLAPDADTAALEADDPRAVRVWARRYQVTFPLAKQGLVLREPTLARDGSGALVVPVERVALPALAGADQQIHMRLVRRGFGRRIDFKGTLLDPQEELARTEAERTLPNRAVALLIEVQAMQARFMDRHGRYAADLDELARGLPGARPHEEPDVALRAVPVPRALPDDLPFEVTARHRPCAECEPGEALFVLERSGRITPHKPTSPDKP